MVTTLTDAQRNAVSVPNCRVDEYSKEDSAVGSDETRDLPPDGGRVAWLMILAIFGIRLGQGGYLVAWGTFQAFYEDSLLSTSSSSAIAWIGSLQYALDYMPGLLAGRLLDTGYFKSTLILSCVALTVANFTIPECHKYYQFLLSQSILYGIGAGFLYTPTLAIISHYFDRKRPIAYAIVTVGSAIGGVLYPIMFRRLEPSIGFPWTMRFFAFFQLIFFVFGILVLKPRRPPPVHLPGLFDFRGVVTSPAYVCYVIAIFLAFMALFTPLTFMTVKGIEIGLSPNVSFYLIAVVNAATIPGRILSGLVANRLGALNLTIITTLVSIGFILGWAVTESHPTYIGMAVGYGVVSGGFLGLYAVPISQMGAVEDAGRRLGILMTIQSIGALIGPPISGAIHGSNTDFLYVGVFAATSSLGAAVLMIVAKCLYLGREKLWRGIF